MSNFTTYVQNWVFKHYTRKTSRNHKIKKMLVYISTRQDWFSKHTNIEECLKNLELLIGCWIRYWSTSTKRGRTLLRSTTSKQRKSKIWVSITKDSGRPGGSKSRTSEEQQLIRNVHSELQASAVPSRFCHPGLEVWDESPRGNDSKPKGRD